jgi:DNA polymerase-3 subunit gamma/tau
MVSFCGTTITHKQVLENLVILDYDYYFRVVEAALKEDIPANLLLFNDVIEKGFDGHHFISGLAEHFRNLLICKDPRTSSLLEVGESAERQYIEQAGRIDQHFALRALGVLSKADVEYKASRNSRLLVEMALMQISSLVRKKKILN